VLLLLLLLVLLLLLLLGRMLWWMLLLGLCLNLVLGLGLGLVLGLRLSLCMCHCGRLLWITRLLLLSSHGLLLRELLTEVGREINGILLAHIALHRGHLLGIHVGHMLREI
jgi:hypothetical protein